MPTITHNDTTIAIPCPFQSPTGNLKLYAVPTTYSGDGYYLAAWAVDELEPVPACGVEEAHLLGHLTVAIEDSSPAFTPISLAEGVTYEN